MTIYRAPRPDSGFLIVRNEVARDNRLSLKARGLLLLILSRPDNWRTTADQLATENKEGRTAILSAFKELREVGYLRQIKVRNQQGQLSTITSVFDHPELGQPESENLIPAPTRGDNVLPLVAPESGSPESAEPTPNRRTNQEEPEKDLSARRGRFDEFWAIYPKRGKHSNPKEPARQKWNYLVRTVDPDTIIKAVRELAELRRGEEPQHTPQAITWLNQKRFLDDPAEEEKPAPSTPFVMPQPPDDMPSHLYVRWAKAQRDAWLRDEPGPSWRELELVEAS